jgi:hypothetical protein
MIGILRLLNPQGIAGLAAAATLAVLLAIQKGETRHFRKEGTRFEQLYRDGEAKRATMVADFAAAAERARAADRANAARVTAAQQSINRSSRDDYQARLADIRARAGRLRQAASADDRGNAGGSAVPVLPTAASGADEATGQDRLPAADALTASEQAIQLDALINWIRAQSSIELDRRD